MRLPTRDKPRFAEVTGPAGPDLFDAVPSRGRSPAANRSRAWVWLALRLLGALAVLATGAVHLHEFERFYSQIPTIGTLFLPSSSVTWPTTAGATRTLTRSGRSTTTSPVRLPSTT